LTHSHVWHDSFICVTCLIHTCDMTHSYAWHDSFIRLTWLIHTCDMTHKISHFNIISESQQSETFTRETWLHMWIMTHSSYQNYCDSLTLKELLSFWIPLTKWLVLWYHWRVVIHIRGRVTPHVNEWFEKKTRHVTLHVNAPCHTFFTILCLDISFVFFRRHDTTTFVARCVTWLIHMCDTTHPYVWHDSSICVTRLIHMCDTTDPFVWHDSSICVTRLIYMCDGDSRLYICIHATYMYVYTYI